jgi:hypothetical protein
MNKSSPPKIGRQVEDKRPQGAVPDENRPQASCEHAETVEEFDTTLELLKAVIGIDDALFCSGLLKQILWLLVGPDGKLDGDQCAYVIAYLKDNKPRDRTR